MDFLSHYGLFLLQVITLLGAFLAIVTIISRLGGKKHHEKKPKLSIRALNQSFSDMADDIRHAVLTKKQWKAHQKQEKADQKAAPEESTSKRAFVLHFKGDIRASAVEFLRHEITGILSIATPNDEVICCVESGGGVVHGYGLAASQLKRIRDKNIPLTVCVDKVAASGGYMMACVANQIIAAPFAIVGSIGVLAQVPNLNRFLKKHHIDFEQHTAGEFKRTLTVFGENTREGRKKFISDLEAIHTIFQTFIAEHRPQVDLKKVGTGEHWLAKEAYDYHLVDKLMTSDDYLYQTSQKAKLFEVQCEHKKTLTEKLSKSIQLMVERFFASWQEKERDVYYG